ncbi:YCF48-related protein [Marinobacterium maritimum]|uniref:YCF48-related protein n=1 Tax=Marinobacterium maritimum TaxID=500162 RepID=A0ABP3T907_9GAMM
MRQLSISNLFQSKDLWGAVLTRVPGGTVLALGLVLASPLWAQQDALETPAVITERASRSVLMDITRAGDRFITVGERGHILYSDDQGISWQQAQVPVRETLTAISFPTAETGWAVGHSGVVLVSHDAGLSWRKQLDGHRANALIAEQLQQALVSLEQDPAATPGQLDQLDYLLSDARSFVEEGATRAFLDVWFDNEQEGWVLGTFGLILHTRDGGKSWSFIGHELPNPDSFHYFSMFKQGDTILITGEAGSLYRSIDAGASWVSLDSPYEGSLFGITGQGSQVAVFGLKGHAFESRDLGENWQALELGTDRSLIGGAWLDANRLILTGNGGTLIEVTPERRAVPLHTKGRGAFTAVLPSMNQQLLLVGESGIQRLTLNTTQGGDTQ